MRAALQRQQKETGTCKGNWGTRLQKNPQLILQFVVMIQLISRRILRDQDEASEGMFYIIYQVYIPCVRVSVIGAILVCLSITLVILEQAQVALEHRYAVLGWKQSYPLTELGEVKRCKRDNRKAREIGERGRRED